MATPPLIPLWIKIAYTLFMAILIPVYLYCYGPTNFLYFCDVAALMTLVAIWIESPLLLSAALVGIFLPQMLWVVDFLVEVANWLGLPGQGKEWHLTGMTAYMFRPPFFLRFLSFFHFWLPFFLFYLVRCVGYDRRGVVLWSMLTLVLVAVCYFWMPPASPSIDPVTGERTRHPDQPVNINYVFNIKSDEELQQWMSPNLYVAGYLAVLIAIYVVTHLYFWAMMPAHPPASVAA